jgi:hypothetical protein
VQLLAERRSPAREFQGQNAIGNGLSAGRLATAGIGQQHLSSEVDTIMNTAYGIRYDIVAPLQGPVGQAVTFRSVWQIDTGTQIPRLITMYPE